MKCESCGFVDYSIMYPTKPPKYKCEKYGCLVTSEDECKGNTDAKEQEEK